MQFKFVWQTSIFFIFLKFFKFFFLKKEAADTIVLFAAPLLSHSRQLLSSVVNYYETSTLLSVLAGMMFFYALRINKQLDGKYTYQCSHCWGNQHADSGSIRHLNPCG